MKNTLIWTYRPPWNKEKAQCTNCWGYLKELSITHWELHLSHTGQWLARTLTNENFTKGPAESTKAGLEEQKRSIRWVSLKCQPYDRLSYPVPYLFNHFVISEILFLSLSVRYQWSYTIIFKRKLGLRTLKSWWKNRNRSVIMFLSNNMEFTTEKALFITSTINMIPKKTIFFILSLSRHRLMH